MSIPENWPAERVSSWLGFKSVEQFLRRRQDLQSRAGFPDPLPGLGKLMWSEFSLQAWLASQINQQRRKALAEIGLFGPQGSEPQQVHNSTDWSRVLEQRMQEDAA